MENKKQNKPNIPTPNPLKNKKGGFNFYWIYGIIALTFIILQIMASSSDSAGDRSIQKGQLINMLKKQDVDKIVVVNILCPFILNIKVLLIKLIFISV